MLLFVVAENSGVISTTPVLVVVHVFIYYGSGFVRRIPLYFSPLHHTNPTGTHSIFLVKHQTFVFVRSLYFRPCSHNGNKIHDGLPEAYYWCATTIVFRHKSHVIESRVKIIYAP